MLPAAVIILFMMMMMMVMVMIVYRVGRQVCDLISDDLMMMR